MKKVMDDCIGCGMCAEICDHVTMEKHRSYIECVDCEECLLDDFECPGRAVIPS